MKYKIKKVIVLLFLVMSPVLMSNVLADEQPPQPGNNPVGQTGPVGSGNGAPIDGGVSVLITMSAIYGVKKINKSLKNKTEISQL